LEKRQQEIIYFVQHRFQQCLVQAFAFEYLNNLIRLSCTGTRTHLLWSPAKKCITKEILGMCWTFWKFYK